MCLCTVYHFQDTGILLIVSLLKYLFSKELKRGHSCLSAKLGVLYDSTGPHPNSEQQPRLSVTEQSHPSSSAPHYTGTMCTTIDYLWYNNQLLEVPNYEPYFPL